MPQLADLASERAVLNGILADGSTLDDLGLRPGDFTDPRFAAIYQAMARVMDAGRTIDLVAINDQLHSDGAAVPAAFLAQLEPGISANVGHYARKIREIGRKRRLASLLSTVSEQIPRATSEELMDHLEGGLTDIIGEEEHEIIRIGDVVGPAVDLLEKRYQAKGAPLGYRSGFHVLDTLTGGFQPGEFIVLGARPSIGKTALALAMAWHQAAADIHVGFFSSEMAGEQIVLRLLSSIGRVNGQKIRTGLLQSSDFSKVMEASGKLQQVPFLIDDTPNISLVALRSRARRMKRLGVQVIYIDYLTLIRYGDPRTPRHERVGEIGKALKQLARELSIPVIALSQVGRSAEEKPPTLADLRQSGEIEEDADVVLLLHRDRKALTDSGEKDMTTYLDVAKQRNGPTDIVRLMFLPDYATFEEKYEGRGT